MKGKVTIAKRLLAGLLAVLMIISLMPTNTYASEIVDDEIADEITVDESQTENLFGGGYEAEETSLGLAAEEEETLPENVEDLSIESEETLSEDVDSASELPEEIIVDDEEIVDDTEELLSEEAPEEEILEEENEEDLLADPASTEIQFCLFCEGVTICDTNDQPLELKNVAEKLYGYNFEYDSENPDWTFSFKVDYQGEDILDVFQFLDSEFSTSKQLSQNEGIYSISKQDYDNYGVIYVNLYEPLPLQKKSDVIIENKSSESVTIEYITGIDDDGNLTGDDLKFKVNAPDGIETSVKVEMYDTHSYFETGNLTCSEGIYKIPAIDVYNVLVNWYNNCKWKFRITVTSPAICNVDFTDTSIPEGDYPSFIKKSNDEYWGVLENKKYAYGKGTVIEVAFPYEGSTVVPAVKFGATTVSATKARVEEITYDPSEGDSITGNYLVFSYTASVSNVNVTTNDLWMHFNFDVEDGIDFAITGATKVGDEYITEILSKPNTTIKLTSEKEYVPVITCVNSEDPDDDIIIDRVEPVESKGKFVYTYKFDSTDLWNMAEAKVTNITKKSANEIMQEITVKYDADTANPSFTVNGEAAQVKTDYNSETDLIVLNVPYGVTLVAKITPQSSCKITETKINGKVVKLAADGTTSIKNIFKSNNADGSDFVISSQGITSVVVKHKIDDGEYEDITNAKNTYNVKKQDYYEVALQSGATDKKDLSVFKAVIGKVDVTETVVALDENNKFLALDFSDGDVAGKTVKLTITDTDDNKNYTLNFNVSAYGKTVTVKGEKNNGFTQALGVTKKYNVTFNKGVDNSEIIAKPYWNADREGDYQDASAFGIVSYENGVLTVNSTVEDGIENITTFEGIHEFIVNFVDPTTTGGETIFATKTITFVDQAIAKAQPNVKVSNITDISMDLELSMPKNAPENWYYEVDVRSVEELPDDSPMIDFVVFATRKNHITVNLGKDETQPGQGVPTKYNIQVSLGCYEGVTMNPFYQDWIGAVDKFYGNSKAKVLKNQSTKAPAYETKLSLTKKNTKIYQGEETLVATAKFSANTTFRTIEDTKVFSKSGEDVTDLFKPCLKGNTRTDIYLTPKFNIDSELCTPPGDYTLYVSTPQNGGKEVYAMMNFVVYQSISQVHITESDGLKIYKQPGKTASAKLGVKYEGGFDLINYLPIVPKTKKVTWSIEPAIGNGNELQWKYVKIDKNGKITIDKKYVVNDNPSFNMYTVKVKAADRPNSEADDSVIFEITSASTEISTMKIGEVEVNNKGTVSLTSGQVMGKTIRAYDSEGNLIENECLAFKSSNLKVLSFIDGCCLVSGGGTTKITVTPKDGSSSKTFTLKIINASYDRLNLVNADTNEAVQHEICELAGGFSNYSALRSELSFMQILHDYDYLVALTGTKDAEAETPVFNLIGSDLTDNFKLTVSGGKLVSLYPLLEKYLKLSGIGDEELAAYSFVKYLYVVTPTSQNISLTLTDKSKKKGDEGYTNTLDIDASATYGMDKNLKAKFSTTTLVPTAPEYYGEKPVTTLTLTEEKTAIELRKYVKEGNDNILGRITPVGIDGVLNVANQRFLNSFMVDGEGLVPLRNEDFVEAPLRFEYDSDKDCMKANIYSGAFDYDGSLRCELPPAGKYKFNVQIYDCTNDEMPKLLSNQTVTFTLKAAAKPKYSITKEYSVEAAAGKTVDITTVNNANCVAVCEGLYNENVKGQISDFTKVFEMDGNKIKVKESVPNGLLVPGKTFKGYVKYIIYDYSAKATEQYLPISIKLTEPSN